MTWETFGVLLVVGMVPFATANPILYAYVANWRRSPEGRAVMHLFVALAFLVDLAVVFELVPDFPAKQAVACLVYAVILVGMIRFTVLLIAALRDQRRKP